MLMKKFITLLLVLTGMVSTASATDYYVSGDKRIMAYSDADWGIREENKMHETSVANVYALVVTGKSVSKSTSYYFKFVEKDGGTEHWYGYDAGEGNTDLNVSEDGTYTIVYYYNTSTHKGRFIATPMLRWDLGNSGSGNWDWKYEAASMMTRNGDFSWTMEISPATFTKNTSLRIYSAIWDKSAYPNGKDIAVTYGGASVSSAYFNYTSSTDWSWKITKPTYTFEKVVITATYKPFDTTNDADFGQWEVRADAYISKTVSKANKYATLGCYGAALDLSGLAAQNITAYPLTVTSKGKITKGSAITTVLAANTGVLLESASENDETLSIPVSAEAGAAVTNHLIATSGSSVDKVTETGYTNFILANQDEHIGFYMVNSAGNSMGANTAYLHVADAYLPDGSARAFLSLDDETTGIEAVKTTQNLNSEYFNIAGQRVAQPTKGLYIVNGKKVIMK